MNRAIKKQSSLYIFLEPYLETGDETAIAQAREQYWKNYKQNWKKQKRAEQKTFEISFTKQEWLVIKQVADTHNRSYARFIKASALAYCQNTYLIPNQLAYNNIQQALTMLYNRLKDIQEDELLSAEACYQLLQIFELIQNKIETELTQPKTIEEVITEAIQSNPEFKSKISKLILNIF